MIFKLILLNGIVCYDNYNKIYLKENNYNYKKLIINILYSIIVFSIFVIYLFINFNKLDIELYIYNLNFIVQFLIFNYICRFNNIYKFYKNYYNENFNFLIIIPIINILLIISYIIYSESYNINYKYLILNCINYFLGLNNLLFNIINFIIIFSIHLVNLYNCYSNFKNLIENNINRGYLNIIKEIINLKYNICTSISNFHFIFNYFTLINIISIILIFQKKNYSCISLFIIIKSCLIEIICLFIILFISEFRSDISTLIYSPLFSERFLKKVNLDTLNEITENDINVDLEDNIIHIDNEKLVLNMLNDNSNCLEWIVIKEVIGNRWVDFKLCGIKLHNVDSITKLVLIITFIYNII